MSVTSSEQNQENEFIKNFDKKFITIPKKIESLQKLTKKNVRLDNRDTDYQQSYDNINTASKILERSRGTIMNSYSMKTMNSLPQNEENMGKSTSISRLKAKQQKVDKILTKRFAEYKEKLSKSINKLESICEQSFGGLQNINSQLSKHQLSKQQLVEYYAKMLPPHSDLPKILEKYKSPHSNPQKLPKLRSISQKRISFLANHQQKKKKQLKHNKWYIEPQKRFSISNDKTVYDWRTQQGVRNVIRSEELRIRSKEIDNLIKEVKQKFNREPVFCKYVRMA